MKNSHYLFATDGDVLKFVPLTPQEAESLGRHINNPFEIRSVAAADDTKDCVVTTEGLACAIFGKKRDRVEELQKYWHCIPPGMREEIFAAAHLINPAAAHILGKVEQTSGRHLDGRYAALQRDEEARGPVHPGDHHPAKASPKAKRGNLLVLNFEK